MTYLKLFEVILTYPKRRSAFVPSANQVTTHILNELRKHKGTYVFQEHEKRDAHQIHLGVHVKGASIVVLSGHFKLRLTRSLKHEELWYLTPTPHEEALFYSCGKFTIEAYDSHGQLIAKEKMIALPLTIPIEQYELLRTEIRDMMTMFEVNPSYFTGQDVSAERFDSPKLKLFFDQFMNDVHIVLTDFVFLERNAFNPYSTVNVLSRNIQHVLNHEYQILSLHHKQLRDELQTRQNTATLPRPGADYGMTAAINKKQAMLKESISRLTTNMNMLQHMLNNLHSIPYATSLLNDYGSDLEKFQLSLDPSEQEKKLMKSYQQIMNLFPQLSLNAKTLTHQMFESPRLFDIWALLKLYVECMKLQFVPRASIIERLLKHQNQYQHLNGMVMHFSHAKTQDRLIVVLSPKIVLDDKSVRQPDIVVSFKNIRKGSYNHHALDVSHLPYQNQHYSYLLRNHLIHSRKRYIDDLAGTPFQMTSTTLVHSSFMQNWNVQLLEGETAYTHSHYHLTPDQTNSLRTYVKRILHQYNGNTNYCPACGSTQRGIPYPSEKRAYKWTHVCDCTETWVSHLCKKEGVTDYHIADEPENVWLLKYASENYNPLSIETWDVHCPACNRDQSGNIHIQNIDGERIELQFEN